MVACLIVIGGGIYQLAIGKTENLQSGFKGTTTNLGHIALAFYNGLWAYGVYEFLDMLSLFNFKLKLKILHSIPDGWSAVTAVTEEIKSPEK